MNWGSDRTFGRRSRSDQRRSVLVLITVGSSECGGSEHTAESDWVVYLGSGLLGGHIDRRYGDGEVKRRATSKLGS